MANPIDMYGPYYGGFLDQQNRNQDRSAQNTQQGMQALGILSQMARQQEQSKLLAEQVNMAKLKAVKEQALLDMFIGGGAGGNVAEQALTQGAGEGDVGPTNTNAQRMGLLSQSSGQPGVPGSRFSPQQYEALSYMNPPAARALLDARKAFLPNYEVKDGAIVGGAPGQVPQFQGFTPQAKISDQGQGAILRPDGAGGMTMSAPAGAVELFGQYKRAGEAARGADPIATGNQALDYAKAADAGIAVPPRAQGVPLSGGRTHPGQLSQAQILQNELATEEDNLVRARSRGDLNAMRAAENSIGELKREMGIRPAAAAPQPGLAISPAQQRKIEEERPQATYALRTNTANLDRLASAAADLEKDPGLKGITGIQGALPNIPGGAAANAEAKLDNLKNQVFVNTLQAMRDASKTGGALGSVSEKEGSRMENALVSLRNAQSSTQLRAALRDIVKISNEAKARTTEAYQLAYPNRREQIIPPEGMSAPAQGGANVVDFRTLK